MKEHNYNQGSHVRENRESSSSRQPLHFAWTCMASQSCICQILWLLTGGKHNNNRVVVSVVSVDLLVAQKRKRIKKTLKLIWKINVNILFSNLFLVLQCFAS